MSYILKAAGARLANLFKGNDMRPYADKIAARVLARADEAKTAGKPLVLLMGENHAKPSHKVIQMLVLKKLKEAGRKIALGIELPHNNLGTQYVHGNSIQEEKAALIQKHAAESDPHGVRAIQISLGTGSFLMGNLSQKSFLKFALDEKISTHFNDAAFRSRSFLELIFSGRTTPVLDFTDALTRRAADKSGKEHTSGPEAHTPDAVHIRNHAIVDNALDHAQRTGAEIYVQNCGIDHIAGGRDDGFQYPYDQSLSVLFRQAGAPVAAAFLSGHDFNKSSLPEDMDLAPDEIMTDIQPPEREFIYPSYDLDFRCREETYLKTLLEKSGLAPEKTLVTVADMDRSEDEIMKLFREWDEKFYEPPKAANDAYPPEPDIRRVTGP